MKSLKRKLILFIVSILVVLSAVNLAVGLVTSYRGLVENVERDLVAVRDTAQIAISNQLSLLEERVNFIASQSVIKSGITAQSVLESADILGEKYGMLSVALVDATGKLYSSDKELQGTSVKDEPYFVKAKETRETVMSSTVLTEDGQLVVYVCAPIGTDGSMFILSTYDGMIFSNIIKDIRIGDTGNIFILDNQATMIANMRPELVEQRQNFIELAKTDNTYKTSAEVYQRMINQEVAVSKYNYKGADRICAFAPIEGSDGWSFGVAAPIDEMIVSIRGIIIGLCASSAILLLIGVLVTIRMARKIADPIVGLTRRVELLAEGDLTTPVPDVDNKDEVAVLAQSLRTTVVSLNSYIHEISNVLQTIADGNLNISVSSQFKGEFQQIGDSMKRILDSLNASFHQIMASADHVSSSSEQVSAGAQALSQGAVQQASSVEELAATITSISTKIQTTTENAVQVSQKASNMGKEAEESNQHMQHMVSAMEDIRTASSQIGKIIKTIQDIAFQTNILALNASVEAARAGAAGKGFAVVADEVRNLANKSKEAADNTTTLIETALKAVESGTSIAGQTAEVIQMVLDDVKDVTQTIQDISEASQEQTTAVLQIHTGIDQISNVVQTNSATAEQSAAASEELSGQAQLMKNQIQQFQLRESDTTDEFAFNI